MGFAETMLRYLHGQPFVLLFLVVAVGYTLGKLQLKGVSLGATGSTLVVSLILSVWASGAHGVRFDIPPFASTIFFNLFMFAVGMKVGPQFISGLRRDVRSYVLLATLVPVLSLGLMLLVSAIFKPPIGLTPGIFAGANTATPGLGSAQSAYERLMVGKEEALSNLSTAFAFSYCISMTLFIVAMKVMPRLFGRDVVRDAHELEEAIAGPGTERLPGSPAGFLVGRTPARVRTYRLERDRLVGRNLADLRREHPRVAVERVLRGGQVIEGTDDVVLQRGDVIAFFGRVEVLLVVAEHVGPEVDAPAIRDVGAETVEVVLSKPDAVNHKLIDVARDAGHGLYLNALFRGGVQIPHGPETVLRKGDVVRVTGSVQRIARLEERMGRVVRPTMSTDIVTVALGLALGAFVGAIAIRIGPLTFALSSSVGLLLVGIGLSTIRTRYPAFGGPFPEPARALLEDLGLNVFIAILGLNSGAGVLEAIASGALVPIIVGCLIVGFIPPLAAWVLGQYRLKMNSALLLGGVAGARCNSAGMRAGQEASHSTVPAISYPVTFALSNIFFTLMTYGLALFA